VCYGLCMNKPDPNVSGPCQVQASPLCLHVGTLRLDPMDMLDSEATTVNYVPTCQPCFDHQADLFIKARHAATIKVNDLVRLTRTGSSMVWKVCRIEAPHALVDLARGSALGPQWEQLADLEVIR
jgi:hypothetical protein